MKNAQYEAGFKPVCGAGVFGNEGFLQRIETPIKS
jgi:hypothetical protein